MKTIEIPKYSIIMTIGPSNCGKSYLCQQIINQLDNENISYKYLSSDNERRDVLNSNLHKHDFKMNAASKGAFNLLYNKLDVYSSYPNNIPVIIVDATNISINSRNDIAEFAVKNNYNLIGLVFDYKDKQDYFKYIDDKTDKFIINSMIKKMRTEVLHNIDKKAFKSINYIDSIDFSNINFTFNFKVDDECFIPHKNVCIVGDIHGCYDEFLEMLSDNKGIIFKKESDGIPKICYANEDKKDYVHHILIGDYIDKGNKIIETIEFIYKNKEFFTIISANHESWVYKYMEGIIKNPDNDIKANFDSVNLFQFNEQLYLKFKDIFENHTIPFGYNDKFIVTHAPCKNKYLGKEDKVSLKEMNTVRYPKKLDYDTEEKYLQGTEDYFQYLINDSDYNFKYHIFGHVMLKSVFMNKNKIGIDTGCVAGGMLSTAIFMEDNIKPFIKKYKSRQPITKQLYDLFRLKQFTFNYNSLERDLQKRIKFCTKNNVNFISGTMSPVNKHLESNDLESLAMGIKYYIDNGITSLILEPKMMGSRCNLFLHKSDVTKCKALSRNAFEITNNRLHSNGKTLEDLYSELQIKYANLFEATESEYILFDGELLPWNALGKELIEKDFMIAYKACNSEHSILNETGFEELLNEINKTSELTKHEERMKKEYDSFKDEILPLDVMQNALDNYKNQLDIFGNDAELEYKPFAILKTIKFNGEEENWVSSNHTNLAMFDLISDLPYCYINITNDRRQKAVIAKMPIDGKLHSLEFDNNESPNNFADCIEFFWNYITNQKQMEGIVIKPNVAYIPNIAPYLKCRNTEYLRLTYGFDYDVLPVKTKKLIENKSINNKLKTSIKEYELGKQLLNIPMKQISIDNKDYVNLIVQLISEQKKESELDPRL